MPLAVQVVVVEREAGTLMHRRVVVDDGDLPSRSGRDAGRDAGVVDHPHDIVLVGHSSSASVNVLSIYSSLGAVIGSLIRNTVPWPGCDSSRIVPPSRRVTRL